MWSKTCFLKVSHVSILFFVPTDSIWSGGFPDDDSPFNIFAYTRYMVRISFCWGVMYLLVNTNHNLLFFSGKMTMDAVYFICTRSMTIYLTISLIEAFQTLSSLGWHNTEPSGQDDCCSIRTQYGVLRRFFGTKMAVRYLLKFGQRVKDLFTVM